jgi:hypothetical protein
MPPNDALDPGPSGDYPHWPRRPDGKPAGMGHPATTPEEEAAEERMPTGEHRQKVPGTNERVLTDQTPRHPDGSPIEPPDLPPDP